MLFSYVHVCSFITYEEELYMFSLNSKSRIYFYLNSFIRFDISEHDKLNQIEKTTFYCSFLAFSYNTFDSIEMHFQHDIGKIRLGLQGKQLFSCLEPQLSLRVCIFFIHDVMLNSRCGGIKHVSL